MKKVRYCLHGVRFVLKTDARVLVAQLNQSGTELPRALVTRWIAWIQLFDFEVRHIPGRKHTEADGLSRRPPTIGDKAEAETETDIDDFILEELNSLRVLPISLNEPTLILTDKYSGNSWKIATYLITIRRPPEMTTKEFNSFKKKAIKFKVQDNHLFRRNSKNVPMRRVVDDPVERQTILQQLHDESSNKGGEGTYRRVVSKGQAKISSMNRLNCVSDLMSLEYKRRCSLFTYLIPPTVEKLIIRHCLRSKHKLKVRHGLNGLTVETRPERSER